MRNTHLYKCIPQEEEENGEQTHSLKEFDFLINGTLLHKTLNDAITDLTLVKAK